MSSIWVRHALPETSKYEEATGSWRRLSKLTRCSRWASCWAPCRWVVQSNEVPVIVLGSVHGQTHDIVFIWMGRRDRQLAEAELACLLQPLGQVLRDIPVSFAAPCVTASTFESKKKGSLQLEEAEPACLLQPLGLGDVRHPGGLY